MKRWCLLATTLSALGLTYLVLSHFGWFRTHAHAASVQTSTTSDPLLSSPGTRWRHSEPHHWRAYVLKQ